jgi:hypothetical protein
VAKQATLEVLPELIGRVVLPLLPHDASSCALFCCCLIPPWFSSVPGARGQHQQAPPAAQHFLLPTTHTNTPAPAQLKRSTLKLMKQRSNT